LSLSLSEVIIPLFTHFIPILFFVYMGIDVLLRNPKKVEHRLVSVTALCFMLLFTEEYVRHQLPLEYSSTIAALWFSTVGIIIPGLGFHLFIKLTHLENKMPRYIYPYIFYLPLIMIVFIVFYNDHMISANEFYQEGVWKLPIYNKSYYIAMIASIVNNLLYLIPLIKGRANASTKKLREIYNLLIIGVIVSACWFIVFGLIDFGNRLPPYPYLYGGLIWCFFLRHTMKRYDFLDFLDKRYEKMFNLNPAAIILADLKGNIKEANPCARQLFEFIHLDPSKPYRILNDNLRLRIQKREEIKNYEMTIVNENKQLDVLIDGDYVLVEYQPHIILILRDITQQKMSQREVTFLAYHDSLTRLPNRRYFYEQLEAAINSAGIQHNALAVVLIDLDRFKDINDTYGHHAGDQVLLHVANLIRETASHHGMAARLGGDEFVFFIHPAASVPFVEEIIHNLQAALAQNKLIYEQETIAIEMSIGASFFPENGQDVDALLNSADKAMYNVKRNKAD
jgi:diguanylate cyclase (GGDEF)-like protein